MTITLSESKAFVQLSHANFLLCIGERADVEKADAKVIADMVEKAIAEMQFRELPVKVVH